MTFFIAWFGASWDLLREAAVYILFGIVAGGLLKVFLSPAYIARHLGQGRVLPVVKAALFGIPLPLCSCGVLPAAAALKKQGANNGATVAFMISTPESGVDSISISYALLDPLLTVARPLAAFASALAAGLVENFWPRPQEPPGPLPLPLPLLSAAVVSAPAPATLAGKFGSGLSYAFGDLWGDIALWFFSGVLLAGLITVLVPEAWITAYLGGGLSGMLLMLLFGIPLYICATASTPIAAAMILKGVSPGAALVFMLVGPATNLASLAVLVKMLGKRATVLYLVVLASSSVGCGLLLDRVYDGLGISARAIIGEAAEIVPESLQWLGALILLALSLKPLGRALSRRFGASPPAGNNCGPKSAV